MQNNCIQCRLQSKDPCFLFGVQIMSEGKNAVEQLQSELDALKDVDEGTFDEEDEPAVDEAPTAAAATANTTPGPVANVCIDDLLPDDDLLAQLEESSAAATPESQSDEPAADDDDGEQSVEEIET